MPDDFICAVPDSIGLDQTCAWPDGRITWAILDLLPDLTEEQMTKALTEVYSHISSECGITPEQISTAMKARILVSVGNIDGPSGTLAWSQLPCGNVNQVWQKYDSGERKWVIHPDGIPPQGTLDWWRVVLHETCHALGLPHGGDDILKPMYDPRISRIGEWTRNELRRRYGPPKQIPPNPQPNPSPGGGKMTKDELKAKIADFLATVDKWISTAEWIASLTFFTKVDDNAVAFVKNIAAKLREISQNEMLLDLLLIVLNLGPKSTLIDALPYLDQIKVMHMEKP